MTEKQFPTLSCAEINCDGQLTELPTDEQTTPDSYTEARCELCDRHQKLKKCSDCGAIEFDHTETVCVRGWIDENHLHTRTPGREVYVETGRVPRGLTPRVKAVKL